MKRTDRITIVGGGIAGLTLANSLLREGFKPKIFEKEPEHRQAGGLGIYPNALLVLERLGMLDRVKEQGNEVARTLVHDTRGRKILDVDSPKVVILRKHLYAILLESLPGDILEMGERFVRFEENDNGIRLYLDSGRSEDGDVLVGGDGIWSRVRAQLFGEQPARYVNFIYRGLVPRPPGMDLRVMHVVVGNGSKYHQICVNEKQVGWSITTNEVERREQMDVGEVKTMLLERVKRWDSPAAELIAETDPDLLLQHGVYDRQPLPRWHRGRAVLMGDAAHPQHPALGQGACMAMESAAVLAACIASRETARQAFTSYQRIRNKRMKFVFSQSRRMARMGQWENPLLCGLRNTIMRLGSRSRDGFATRMYHRVIYHDIYEQIREELAP